MKSIMHEKDGTCYLCVLLHSNYSPKVTQEHHVIFGIANRKQSEKYGLKVNLCLEHHEHGKEAVHMNAEIALILKKEAQKVFEEKYPNLSFLGVFGKNYLDDADRQQNTARGQNIPFTFQIIEDGIEGIDW
mgnify:CR=1 FL=1